MNFVVKDFAFFNAPKNGGSSIRAYLRVAQGTYRPLGQPYETNVGNKKALRGYLRHDFERKPDKQSCQAFCVYRNPRQRLVSAYKDKVIRKKQLINNVERFVEILNCVWDSGKHPKNFLSWREKLKSTEKEREELYYLLRHFMPQSYWWVTAQNMDFVLDFRNWHAIRKVWSALLDTNLPDLHLRNSKALKNSSEAPIPREFGRFLEKVYVREQAYALRAENGGEAQAMLQSIKPLARLKPRKQKEGAWAKS